jgi:hypothetical protein
LETIMVNIRLVIVTNTARRHLNLRRCFRSRFALSSSKRLPSVQRLLFGATLTSGVPSARQNASDWSA